MRSLLAEAIPKVNVSGTYCEADGEFESDLTGGYEHKRKVSLGGMERVTIRITKITDD
jgi:hypothetical protein